MVKLSMDSPSVGLWSAAISIQVALGVLLSCIGNPYAPFTVIGSTNLWELQVNAPAVGNFATDQWTFFFYLGVANILGAAISFVFSILTIFLFKILACPLAIIGYLQSVFAIVTSGFCSVYVRAYLDRVILPERVVTNPVLDDDAASFAALYASPLLVCAVLSLAVGILYFLAQRTDAESSVPAVLLMSYSAAVSGAVGIIFLVGGGGVGATTAFGVAWMIIAVVELLVCALLSWSAGGGPICKLIGGVSFSAATAFGILSLIFIARTYYIGAVDRYPPIEFLQTFQIMHNGSWMLAGACGGVFVSIIGTMASLHCIRSFLCCNTKSDT